LAVCRALRAISCDSLVSRQTRSPASRAIAESTILADDFSGFLVVEKPETRLGRSLEPGQANQQAARRRALRLGEPLLDAGRLALQRRGVARGKTTSRSRNRIKSQASSRAGFTPLFRVMATIVDLLLTPPRPIGKRPASAA
jgi:hypothetical protein